MAVKKTNDSISIPVIKQGTIKLRLIGQTPMYFNSMSSKAKRDLLVGAGRKTAAEKKKSSIIQSKSLLTLCIRK